MDNRKLIEVVASEYVGFQYSNLKSIKEEVEELILKYGEDATIKIEDDYGDGWVIRLHHKRLENKAETRKRLSEEARIAELQKRREKKEFERLSKIFGNQ
jgi:di/tripeptidase